MFSRRLASVVAALLLLPLVLFAAPSPQVNDPSAEAAFEFVPDRPLPSAFRLASVAGVLSGDAARRRIPPIALDSRAVGERRDLVVGLTLLDGDDREQALIRRLGNWRLEAVLVNDRAKGAKPGKASSRRANPGSNGAVAVRLRGRGASGRLRAEAGFAADPDEAPGALAARPDLEQEIAGSPEFAELAYDLLPSYPVWGDLALGVTVSGQRERLGWSDAEILPLARSDVEELAAANLRLSLFPWLRGWWSRLDYGFERTHRSGAAPTGRDDPKARSGGDRIDEQRWIRASWSQAWGSLGYGYVTLTGQGSGLGLAAAEERRSTHELRVEVRPHATLALDAAAGQTQVAGSHRERSTAAAGFGWHPHPEWSLSGSYAASNGGCGRGCLGGSSAVDARLGRAFRIVGPRGLELPAELFARSSRHSWTSRSFDLATSDRLWSADAGLSITF